MSGRASGQPSVLEVVHGLRALRDFAAEPLRDADLDTILEAARSTGTERNRQRWAIVVVTDSDQRRRLAACGDHTDPLRRAGSVLALVQEPGGYEFDIGRVSQNAMLAASEINVASCPVTLHRDTDARPVLGLGPDRRCRYAIAFGYPSADARPGRLGGRRPLANLVHHGTYAEAEAP